MLNNFQTNKNKDTCTLPHRVRYGCWAFFCPLRIFRSISFCCCFHAPCEFSLIDTTIGIYSKSDIFSVIRPGHLHCLGSQHNQYKPSHSFERNSMGISRTTTKKKGIEKKEQQHYLQHVWPNSVPYVDSINSNEFEYQKNQNDSIINGLWISYSLNYGCQRETLWKKNNTNSIRCDHRNGSDNRSTNECKA